LFFGFMVRASKHTNGIDTDRAERLCSRGV
jgi:hypothetical protein